MNTWKKMMREKLEFAKAMRVVVDTYQHESEKTQLGMSDIDGLCELIKYELYRKNEVISEKQYQEWLDK